MPEIMALLLFISVCLVLLTGYPVAFALGGTALLFAFLRCFCFGWYRSFICLSWHSHRNL